MTVATTKLDILNLALQACGASRVGSVNDSSLAEEADFCYSHLKRGELRQNGWAFARKRKLLPASTVVPAFGFATAFPLPTDCIRIIKPVRQNLDWVLEVHEAQLCLLTNQDSAPAQLKYIWDATENLFDPLFCEMLAYRIGWHIAEKVTQSNSKRDAIKDMYVTFRREARRINGFEKIPDKEPLSEWLTGQQVGSFAGVDFVNE